MLRTICVYTLMMIAITFIGTALARPEAPGPEAGQLPTFEMMGMPVTPVQMQLVGSAHVRESPPTPMLVVDGMPASPHQVAVLTPPPRPTPAAKASSPLRQVRLAP